MDPVKGIMSSHPENSADRPVERPTNCPFCNAKSVDTLAKVITASTSWRCRTCEQSWTIASLKPQSARP